MKLQLLFAALITALSLVISTTVQAHAIGFKSDVGNLFERGAVLQFTDKYQGYQSAKIFFNSLLLRLVVYKQSSGCVQAEPCSLMISEAPLEVYFEVKRVERFGCYDSYYAKTPDAVRSAILEQIIIHRFASERCQTLVQVPEGAIHYKISGLNSETGEAGSAEVFAKLFNIQLVRIDN